MKRILLSLSCLLIYQGAFAQCTNAASAIQNAQTEVQMTQGLFDQGSASKYDVLMAEKNELELKLCAKVSDYASYKALATNVTSRLQLIKAAQARDGASLEDVTVVSAEASGMAAGCKNLLKIVSNLFNAGVRTTQDVYLVQSACDILR